MRKFFTYLAALLLVSASSYGQVIRDAGDTISLAQDLRAAFSTLNANRLATGILLDQVPVVSGPHGYDGSAGAMVNSYANWLQQYWEYYQASPNKAALPTLASIQQTVRNKLAAGQIPLLVLAYRYDELRPDAVTQGLIRIDSAAGRAYDGPNMRFSPYQQRNLFAVALGGQTSATGNATAYVGSDLWLGTTPAPATLHIDFDDGAGPRTVAMNSVVQLNNPYQTPPVNPGGPVSRRASSTTLASVPARTLAVTDLTTGLQASATYTTLSTLAVLPDMVLGLKASHNWNNLPAASAVGWVQWGNGNNSGRFRKPVVFVEGIDFGCNKYADTKPCNTIIPGNTAIITNFALANSAINGSYRNGSAGWNEMVDYNDDFPAVEKLPSLREQLIQQGYDVIYLDFSDGATHIQSNAMTLVELLDYINNPANRAPGATETIVTAASMGGQVARFALAWMEQQSLCHNSKLYVSIDSPHRGANIPLGLQYMFDRLRDMVIGGGDVDIQRDKLLRPASMQMLIYHFSPDATNLRTQWQAWQASPGSYPSLLRKVAIANGNRLGQALPGAFPGMELLTNTSFISVVPVGWGQNVANSLPGAGSRGHDNVIFRYKPGLARTWHYTQVNSSYPTYDQAPGGTRPTSVDAQKQSHDLLQSGSDYQTFIPAISALDVAAAGSIASPNLYYNIGSNIPDSKRPDPNKYAFEAYYAPNGISEPHINISNGQSSQYGNPPYTSDNTSWILNELLESAHNLPTQLNSTYNYGSLYRRLLPSVEVVAGGQLFINNANLPNSGGVSTANDPKENTFEVYTSSCGSRVQVDQSGRLALGQSNDTHVGSLRIANNSLLDLRAGSQTTVNAGSVLRVQRGGTLVVRQGATLTSLGQIVVEEGAYICVEDPASIVTTGGGTYTVSPLAIFAANPALGLGNLACRPSGLAPLSVSFSTFVYRDLCSSNAGRPNYGQWTVVASGGGGVGTYHYQWFVDFSGTGNNYQSQFVDNPNFGICLGVIPAT